MRALIDRGGTFTDLIVDDEEKGLTVHKLLSSDSHENDPLLPHLGGLSLADLRMGTTVATNALLERRGERVLLVTTKGFGDLLEIATQERPELFSLQIKKRQLLHAQVVEIDERILADGTVERVPDSEQIAQAIRGWDAIAVVFLHAPTNPAHELLVEQIARKEGCTDIALSHQISPETGAVGRGDTTVADAYLTPLLRRSVEQIASLAPKVRFMQSSGGLADHRHFMGKDAILSGPAGGVVAVAHLAQRAGFDQVIGLDMGGTSTDVCRWDGSFHRQYETVVSDVRIRAPMLDVVTVAAGGGSILSYRDGRFTVGPESAGANPGPACYGKGGPATLTDANLILGHIQSNAFPHMDLDGAAAHAALAAFGDPFDSARGFLKVANDNMAAAVRRVATARGHDLRDHALVAFGGAGGQHACALARSLGIKTILCHPLAGVLSAWGMGLADIVHHEVAPIPPGFQGEEPPFPVEAAIQAMSEQGCEEVEIVKSVDARYQGTDDVLHLPWSPTWRQTFEDEHRRRFSFTKTDHPIELVAARVQAISSTAAPEIAEEPCHDNTPSPLQQKNGLSIFAREDLSPGDLLQGPAVVTETSSTLVVDEGWKAQMNGFREIVLSDTSRPNSQEATITEERDPVSLEVMSNRFMAIAEQMGEQLKRVAHSTNIKERLDFSCAVFDKKGGLVANAPHIPVHLGAMSVTVQTLLHDQTLQEGDTWLVNDPYRGGSHLPDLTLISPVFRDGHLAFFVANRGHHADVGGSDPGSMPPHSKTIAEEGVLFSAFLLVRDGFFNEEGLAEKMRADGVRHLSERLSDLRAQIASNTTGIQLLDALCDSLSTEVVHAWMNHVQDNGAEVMAEVINELQPCSFEDQLDDGTRLAVRLYREGDKAVVDFAGTAAQHPGNRNAPRAVTMAAVLYVFRCLAHRDIPLNQGCLRPLDIRIPPRSLLDPEHPAAVVGGNVETSQRIVDLLFGALGRLAASQGTMNNLTFGNDDFAYYETLCGGAGAGLGFDGASAIHTHMTNTRITDPEILEQRYPVVVDQFSVRRGSGGKGVWQGGDGVVRKMRFLKPLSVSLLAERRITQPFGLRAEHGARGEEDLSSEGVTVVTPGGGGYTPSNEEWANMPPDKARKTFREDRWHGPTQHIATGFLHAHLLIVEEDLAEKAADELSENVVLQTAPGELFLDDDLGPGHLCTDLPGYEAVNGEQIEARGSQLDENPLFVAFLVESATVPRLSLPHLRGSKGNQYITNRPLSK
ncbi:MAG: hydantoinase B/oxoprolinase family protein [Planctomycetota bacterium]|nr:hydantoinase B/oxoprolinase family protein [Planctomycetota bacterium]